MFEFEDLFQEVKSKNKVDGVLYLHNDVLLNLIKCARGSMWKIPLDQVIASTFKNIPFGFKDPRGIDDLEINRVSF